MFMLLLCCVLPGDVVSTPLAHTSAESIEHIVVDALANANGDSATFRVYVINLVRREDRREIMRALLDNQGLLNVTTFVDAVDGFELSLAQMQREGLHPMPGWPLETKSLVQIADSVNARCGLEAARDLYGHAATYWTRGVAPAEVGCMLSHVAIWERVCARGGVDTALIFEDDVELAPNFEKRLRQYLRALPAGWELFHLKDDPLIPGFYYDERAQREGLIGQPEYERNTWAYVVTVQAACKLARAFDPQNIIAADDFLAAMVAPHPRPDVRALYPPSISGYKCRIDCGVSMRDPSGTDSDIDGKDSATLWR